MSALAGAAPRPRVTLKLATSLDGKIATAAGESQWITGARARAISHELRGIHGAILVGSGTALADDPELTARGEEPPARQPLRIVLDSRLRLPLDSQLLKTLAFGPVLIAGCGGADPKAKRALEIKGARVVLLPRDARGVTVSDLLAYLAREDEPLDSLFVEGGGRVAASFLEADAVDRIEWFRAPLIMGEEARPGIAGADIVKLSDARRWKRVQVRELDSDLWETYERA
jgi:diaminohydroxyphosphoribosylaminopyrimidine deaminase / 5-amino-6-(5-phosphoribosylamino)uracil reductase